MFLSVSLKSLLPQILLAGIMLFAYKIMMTIRKMMLLLRGRKERKDRRHQKAQNLQEVLRQSNQQAVIYLNINSNNKTRMLGLIHKLLMKIRIEATLNDMMSNQFRNAKEHTNEPLRIVEVIRVTTKQQHGLDFMEQIIMMRENDKPICYSEADFKYLNKNYIEDVYYLCLSKKFNYCKNKLLNSLMTFIRICVIWERVHNFQLGIESYQIKINLTAPTLIFLGIKAYDPYSIVDKPDTGLIFLNSKNEKRVMYLVEIVKFCDATLERVLKEVKLKIFETEF
ncbi:hypothetical protein Tco_0410229 [Tanacetum coccineum]